MTRTGGGDEDHGLRRQSRLIAVGCVLGDGVPFALHAVDSPAHPGVWLAGLAIVAVDLALALPARTAAPVAVAHAVVRLGVAVVLLALTGQRDNGIGNASGLVVSAYRAGAWIEGRASWVVLAALVVGMTGTQVVQGYQSAAANILLMFTNTVLPWQLGRHTTGRSGYIAEVKRLAEEERQAAVQAVAAAAESERRSIARDLHDTISHHVSAVGVHAAAARLRITAGPTTAERQMAGSLEQVEVSSRAALSDLRRMLDLLHGKDTDGVPQRGLGTLDELVRGCEQAGLHVRLRVDGLSPRQVPDSLDLAAYRVIQEILTNALRHGGGVVDLAVAQTATELRITATNTTAGPISANAGTGRGLDGIRHRVELFNGEVTAGPDPAEPTTWRVSLTLPIEESP